MSEYTIKDKVAIIGVGETKYYKRGQAPVPEFRLACEAIMKAAEDAGIDVRDIDGISGYADDRNDASHLATALGLKHLGFAGMVSEGAALHVSGIVYAAHHTIGAINPDVWYAEFGYLVATGVGPVVDGEWTNYEPAPTKSYAPPPGS